MKTQVIMAKMMEREFQNYRKKIRRQKELRIKCLLFFMTAFLLIGLTISYHAIISDANTEIEELSFKYYSSIEVNFGETLWSISGKYMDEHYSSRQDYISEIISINHLKSEDINAGQYLIVPYYMEEFIN